MDADREATFVSLQIVAHKFRLFNDEELQEEWINLYLELTDQQKIHWRALEFDGMWRVIGLMREENGTIKFPLLRRLSALVRSLPASNADPERAFSGLAYVN